MRLAIIGYGNIGRMLVAHLGQDVPGKVDHLSVLVRPSGRAHVPGDAGFDVITSAEDLIASRPDLVVECAGHSAITAYIPACLAAGIDCVTASTGAFADTDVYNAVMLACQTGGSQLIIPAGAIGGIDLLSALGPSGISQVTYEGRKPPAAWRGSQAEKTVDLAAITKETVFFSGSAREAASQYPKNANVAATLALAGIGLDETTVRLIADPNATGNTHSYSVTAGGACYSISIDRVGSPDNPKTSLATVLSLLREITNKVGPLSI